MRRPAYLLQGAAEGGRRGVQRAFQARRLDVTAGRGGRHDSAQRGSLEHPHLRFNPAKQPWERRQVGSCRGELPARICSCRCSGRVCTSHRSMRASLAATHSSRAANTPPELSGWPAASSCRRPRCRSPTNEGRLSSTCSSALVGGG